MFKVITCNLALLCLYIRCAAQHADNYEYSDTNFINSGGLWLDDISRGDLISTQHLKATEAPTSRVDVGGLITSLGLKKGASLLGLIVFPILLPFFIVTGFILFFIFLFISITATSGTAVSTGRHLANSEGFISDDENSIYQHVLDSDVCMERITCEIMKRVTTNKSKELLIGVMEKLTLTTDLAKRLSIAAYKNEDCEIHTCNWKNILLSAFDTET